MSEHQIVVTDEVCPRCICGYSPSAPNQNMESLWRNALSHVDGAVDADHCIACDVELRDVFNNPSAKQYEQALEVKLLGGYGMFFDNFDGDHHVFLCESCSLTACGALPWMAKLLNREVS